LRSFSVFSIRARLENPQKTAKPPGFPTGRLRRDRRLDEAAQLVPPRRWAGSLAQELKSDRQVIVGSFYVRSLLWSSELFLRISFTRFSADARDPSDSYRSVPQSNALRRKYSVRRNRASSDDTPSYTSPQRNSAPVTSVRTQRDDSTKRERSRRPWCSALKPRVRAPAHAAPAP
jgi:hypothetical protein